MLPGPVFHVELLTTARRARYYALRLFYGAILLAVVWQNDPSHYSWYFGPSRVEMTLQQAAALGDTLFRSFATAQAIAVLVVTPTLVAGAIAEEKQRKTLHYLLASRLTSAEIVLGKLCARLLHVGVLIGVGLPVLSLLSLFGGVAPELVVLTFIATLTSLFFVAAFSTLLSVYAQRPRDAVATAYVLELAWLMFPMLIAETMPRAGWPWLEIYDWIRPFNDLVGSSSPLYALTRPGMLARGGNRFEIYLWLVGTQVFAGALLLALAVLRLRPVYRHQGSDGRWAARLRALKEGRRLFRRPGCGHDAMLWKERYVSRTSLVTKLVAGLAFLALVGAAASAAYDVAVPAFKEVIQYGYGSTSPHDARDSLSFFVRMLGVFTYLVWVLGVASAASSSIASEREADTWTSLVATPLDGVEIIRAKMFGAVWGTRWLGSVLLALALLGVAGGAVHPVGLLAAAMETVVFIAFATALGTFLSLRAKSSGRAMTATVGILVMLNGGYLLCCIPLRADTRFITVGVTPVLFFASLLSYGDVDILTGPSAIARGHITWFLTCVVGTIAYGLGGLFLRLSAVGLFDDVAGRPRRLGQRPPPSLVAARIDGDDEVEFLD